MSIDKKIIEMAAIAMAVEMDRDELAETIKSYVGLLELDLKKLTLQLTDKQMRFSALKTMVDVDLETLRLGVLFRAYRAKYTPKSHASFEDLPSTLGEAEEHDPENFEFQKAEEATFVDHAKWFNSEKP